MNGELHPGEPHPAASSAMAWIKALPVASLMQLQESFYSCAIEGNRAAEICSETLHRIMAGQPVSDRYVLGLAWIMKEIEEEGERK